jgi:membrane protease YdiL (CAAX protease family)
MKCPKCGNEIREEDGRCPACGAEIPPKEEAGRPDPLNAYAVRGDSDPDPSPAQGTGGAASRIKIAVKAAFAVILYLLLFFSIQSCLCAAYAASASDTTELAAAVQSGDTEEVAAALLRLQEKQAQLIVENEARLLLAANLVAILVLCLLLRIRRKVPADEIGFHGVNPLRLVQFALFGAAMNIVLSVLLSVIPLPEAYEQMQETQYAALFNDGLVWSVLSVGIVGPAAEEIFFRGIITSRLRPAFGKAGTILVSSLLFGLVHVTPIAVGYAFVVGLALALIRERYRSVLPCIVCHCSFNLTSFWLDRMENGGMIGVLTGLSAAVIVLVWRSAVMRYPSFSDVFHDTAGCIPLDDPEKREIAEECRRLRNSGSDLAESADRIEELADRWNGLENGKRPENGKNDPDGHDGPDSPDHPDNPDPPEDPQ